MNGTMLIIGGPGQAGSITTYSQPVPLADLKAAVGGSIESVPFWTRWGDDKVPCWVVCDEEGKLKGLPVNVLATKLWWEAYPAMIGKDTLHGPVAVLFGDKAWMKSL